MSLPDKRQERLKIHEELLSIKGKNKLKTETRKFHWLAYITPIFTFILSKAITETLKITSEAKSITDIVLVIAIVTGLSTYAFYLNKSQKTG